MCTRNALAAVAVLLAAAAHAPAGEFDRLESERLAQVVKEGLVKPRPSLTSRELDGLPQALKDSRSALLVVKTGQGNYARVLAAPALRKPPEGDRPPVPVLLLERFDTFEPGRSGSRPAHGLNTPLFDGFQIDLDTGQVVPEGQGGDLAFRARDKEEPRLDAVAGATLYAPAGPAITTPAAAGPSGGKAVVPGDYSGRYTLYSDGRWTGLLELRVDAQRQVSGQFRSELNGTSYPVRGEVEAEAPHKVGFTVKFPRTEQEYEGYLWSEGKWALAGTFRMMDRPFGFFAVREGAKVEPAR